MKSQEPFSIKRRIQSFGYALRGLWQFFKSEHNIWIHCVLVVAAVVLGFFLKISKVEWMAILIVIGMVISAEAFNTCIEKIMNLLSPEKDKRVAYIKNLAAGAVLVTAVIAALVGIVIFIPKIIVLL